MEGLGCTLQRPTLSRPSGSEGPSIQETLRFHPYRSLVDLPLSSPRRLTRARHVCARLCDRACAARLLLGRAGGRAGGAHAPGGGANAQQAIRRLLTGESASAGTLGARATARLSSARSLAAALGPSGTKHALALAKALLHDDQVERALIGEGEELEDT